MSERTPPLHTVHDDRGARFTGVGGWKMPVEYNSIRGEHAAVRESTGLFDVSHMGQIELSGPDAPALMQSVTTNDISKISPGDALYTTVVDEDGILRDDIVVYRLPDGVEAGETTEIVQNQSQIDSGAPAYLAVPNAGHAAEAYDRWVAHRDERQLEADVINTSDEWAMFAVQGNEAVSHVGQVMSNVAGVTQTPTPTETASVRDMSRFTADIASVAGVGCWISRTGYTGEDGFELMCPRQKAQPVWQAFDDVRPCGLGARDILRIESGFLLSGQDFDPDAEPRTPFEAGIPSAVALNTEFVGREALVAAAETAPSQRFTGVKLAEQGGPVRDGSTVTDGSGTEIGMITSGTMSPSVGEPIGLGYLPVDLNPGESVGVIVRGEQTRATVVSPPFTQ